MAMLATFSNKLPGQYRDTFMIRIVSTFILNAFLTAVLLGQPLLAQADGDHDEAKRLHQAGDILSLELILERLRPTYPGKILEVELERKSGKIIYEIELLAEDGMVYEIEVDAKNGEVLRSKVDD